MKPTIEQITWAEFKDTGMLWWVNRILHTFGMAIVFETEDDGSISSVYPAKVTFRGFGKESEDAGFTKVTAYLLNESPRLAADIEGSK